MKKLLSLYEAAGAKILFLQKAELGDCCQQHLCFDQSKSTDRICRVVEELGVPSEDDIRAFVAEECYEEER